MQEFLGVADGGGQSHALHGSSDNALQTFQDGEEVPAAVVAGEGMDFIHDDRPQALEERAMVHVHAHQHGFQRLGSGQQNVRTLPQDGLALWLGDIAVPQGGSAAQPGGVGLQPGQQVVEQRLERTDVEDGGAGPVLGGHPGQQGEGGGFGLAARGGGEQHGVGSRQQRVDGLLLKGAQGLPAEGVDDVVQQYGVQPLQRIVGAGVGHGRSSSMSSALAAAALRSTSLSSVAETVSA